MLSRILPLLLVCATSALAAQTNGGSERPAAGAFTEDQATRGKTVYETFCASCHTTSFHTDEQFRFNWFGRTVADLFRTLKTTMPEDNPGGLSDEEYARVIAYILKLNGFAAGADSLVADTASMRRIRIAAAAAAADTTKPPQR